MSTTDSIHILRRRFGTFAVVLGVSLAAAVVAIALLPKQYEASALLFVGQDRPISAGGVSQRDGILAASYVELLAAPAVADRAAQAISGQPSPDELLSHMTFVIRPGTQLIAVKARDTDSRRAAEIANAYAKRFVSIRNASDDAVQRARLDQITFQISRISRQIRDLEDRSGNAVESDLAEARNQLRSLRSVYQSLQESIVLEGRNVSLSSLAVAPTSPAAPKPVLYMAAALFLGLSLAVAAALLRDHLDQRISSEQEVVDLAGVGAPVLTRVPVMKGSSRAGATEAFSFLRVNLLAGGDVKTILITSPSVGDGKTTVVEGLAESFARGGTSVIAADCDFRAAGLSQSLGDQTRAGLADVLAGDASFDQTLVEMQPRMQIAVAGPPMREGLPLLHALQMSKLCGELRARRDVVIVDTAPVTLAVETSLLASAGMDAVVLVVDLKKTTRTALRAALDQLKRSGAPIKGIAINRASSGDAPYGYGY